MNFSRFRLFLSHIFYSNIHINFPADSIVNLNLILSLHTGSPSDLSASQSHSPSILAFVNRSFVSYMEHQTSSTSDSCPIFLFLLDPIWFNPDKWSERHLKTWDLIQSFGSTLNLVIPYQYHSFAHKRKNKKVKISTINLDKYPPILHIFFYLLPLRMRFYPYIHNSGLVSLFHLSYISKKITIFGLSCNYLEKLRPLPNGNCIQIYKRANGGFDSEELSISYISRVQHLALLLRQAQHIYKRPPVDAL